MQQPSIRTWLWVNLKIGALSFGSVSRTVLFQDELVAKRSWLSPEDFQESLTIAQVLPGPNLVNLAVCLGFRLFSPGVALAGLVPLVTPGAFLAVLVGVWVPLDNPGIRALFAGFAIGAFLLMGNFLWMLGKGMLSHGPATAARPRLKVIGRFLIGALVAFGMSAGVAVLPLIFAAVAVCLLWEFLT